MINKLWITQMLVSNTRSENTCYIHKVFYFLCLISLFFLLASCGSSGGSQKQVTPPPPTKPPEPTEPTDPTEGHRYIKLIITSSGDGTSWVGLAELAFTSEEREIPKDNWIVTFVSSESEHIATNAFDNNSSTVWKAESELKNTVHEVQIDLGEYYHLDGFSYLPGLEIDAVNRVNEYQLYLSRNGEEWGNPTAASTFDESEGLFYIDFKSVVLNNCDGNYTICDDFNGTSLNTEIWHPVRSQWGGQDVNGGVVEGNIHFDNGLLVLEGHGSQYEGSVLGINKDLSSREDGKKTGAAIATKSYLGSGIYEVRMKPLPKPGAVSAMWTFHYQELYPDDQEYIDNNLTGDYWVSNHEIDIEFIGNNDTAFDYFYGNAWLGEQASESATNKIYSGNNADGEFHDYKFIWHTGDDDETPRVEFFKDGYLLHTEYESTPFKKGRLWLGVWFANTWAGIADFDSDEMVVDYFRFTAFDEANDLDVKESYPCHGMLGDCIE